MLRGFYLRWDDELNERTHAHILRLTRTLVANPHPALTDVIPGYTTVYLEYDATVANEGALRRWLTRLPETEHPDAPRTIRIPVTYDGPDLEDLAQKTGLSPDDIARRHSAPPYHVFATGFTPGLAFMGPLEPALQVPRRPQPRPQVAAGTVAVANAQTTVYPVASPGGWTLIGRAHRQIYDPLRTDPLLVHAGDRVQFVRSTAPPPPQGETRLELLPADPRLPLLRVVEAGLLDLVVDRGRFHSGRFGYARGGALDTSAAGRANRLVGNETGAALLEVNLQAGIYEACAQGVLAVCGGLQVRCNGDLLAPDSSFGVYPGDRLTFSSVGHGARAYLAFAGGLETNTFRGSASTDLRGSIGRALVPGDVLGVSVRRDVRSGLTFMPFDAPQWPLRLLPGPQASGEALLALTRQTFTVGPADRMGLQLRGGQVPGGEVTSEAVPLGSIQVPPGGTPLLLLNDRGTLGGYSKPAIVHPHDLARVAQLRPGAKVHFRMASGA